MIHIEKEIPIIGIYKITSPSNKIYIGQSGDDINERFYRYKHLFCKSQPRLYNSLKKYGSKNHIFEVIEQCSKEQLLEREIYWKQYYLNELGWKMVLFCQTHDRGGGPRSEETKQKIGLAHKGKKLSKEHIEIIRNANKGRIPSLEERRKKGEKMKGKSKHSLISKEIIGNKNRHPKPKGFSEKLQKPKTNLHRENLSISKSKNPILQYNLDMVLEKEYRSITYASQCLGISYDYIKQICDMKKKDNNYIWKYKNKK